MENYDFCFDIILVVMTTICLAYVNYYREKYLEEKREKEYLLNRFNEYVKQFKNAKE